MILTLTNDLKILVNWANVAYARESNGYTIITFNYHNSSEPKAFVGCEVHVTETLTEIQDLISRERHGR